MAKSLKDYPISFPYGATSSPYSSSNPHHGHDIAAPCGTPIVVSGKQIGLVGTTGFSTGCHCHIDKNKNIWASSGYLKPEGWENITGKVVFAQDAGTAGLCVVIETSTHYWRFLHMSKISVKVGDIIKKEQKKVTNNDKLLLLLSTKFYASKHPDLARNGVKTTAQLKKHWLKYGVKEGRQPSKGFNPRTYLANYGDLRKAYGKNYVKASLHYINNGIREGRLGKKMPVTTVVKDRALELKAKVQGILNQYK